MEKIKELLKNKKFLAGLVAVLLLASVGTVFVLNQPQNKNETVQQETISDEEHAKLLANIKKLQNAEHKKTEAFEADKKSDEEKAKEEQLKKEEEKKQAEEKVKQEAEAKAKEEAEKTQNEETLTNENTTTTTASSNTNSNSSNSSVASNNTTPAVTKPSTPAVAPKPQPKPAEPKPTPIVEKPKPTKYCNYSGNRKALKNLCTSGSFWISNYREIDPNSYPYKKRFKELQQGVFDSIVFHGETDRYYLIEDEDLRNGLKKTPESLCYIDGSCIGFKLP